MSKEINPEELLRRIRSRVVSGARELGAISALSSDVDALPKESLEDINKDPELLDNFWSGYSHGEKIRERREKGK